MSSDIITNLHLDKDCTRSRVLTIQEINNCDSTFIVNSVISHCNKHKQTLLIITCHNSTAHYQNAGLKMSYNLERLIKSDLVHVLSLSDYFIKSVLNDDILSMENIIAHIKNTYKLLKEKHTLVNIIVDGISHLYDLQFNLQEVNKFCNEILTLVYSCPKSFVILHCNVSSEYDITYYTANLLAHRSDILVHVENLPSGWSADVSGRLKIIHLENRFEEEHRFTLEMKPVIYLYKLFERGVKLFAPGTV